MKTYIVSSTIEREVEAEDEDTAMEQFWESIENDCGCCNTTLEVMLSEGMNAKEIKEVEV